MKLKIYLKKQLTFPLNTENIFFQIFVELQKCWNLLALHFQKEIDVNFFSWRQMSIYCLENIYISVFRSDSLKIDIYRDI